MAVAPKVTLKTFSNVNSCFQLYVYPEFFPSDVLCLFSNCILRLCACLSSNNQDIALLLKKICCEHLQKASLSLKSHHQRSIAFFDSPHLLLLISVAWSSSFLTEKLYWNTGFNSIIYISISILTYIPKALKHYNVCKKLSINGLN